MPQNTVKVSRPTFHGNPFVIGGHYKRGGVMGFVWTRAIEGYQDGTYTTIKTHAEAVEWYRWYLTTFSADRIAKMRKELRGKNLGCWCALDQPCHADVLLEIANS